MNKTIISIDVGIKNLAYCILEQNDTNFTIKKWDIINILDDKLLAMTKCSNFIKDKQCNKYASNYIKIKDKDNIYYCDKIICNKTSAKLYPKCKAKTIKKPTAKNTSILELGSILLKKLDLIKSIILDVDEVIIENQPVLKNPTMKSIQMIIFSYFIGNGYNSPTSKINNVYLFSARNKLKLYDGPNVECIKKNEYDKRKFLSIEYTKYYLKNDEPNLLLFNSHTKKDDLADSFKQGYYYLFKDS